MSSQWKPTKLAEVLIPVSRAEAVDPTKEYPLLGVRLEGRGPFLRETVMGSQIAATRLFKVEEGNFIYSRLFAWRGAFGVIEPALDGCYVSGEFPTFKPVPEKIDTEFLRLWFRLPTTIELVEADCTGSTPLTRNRFKENFFLNLEIPLPPLSEQRRIVARIESLAAKIDEARNVRHTASNETQFVLTRQLGQMFDELARHHSTRPFGSYNPHVTSGPRNWAKHYQEGGQRFYRAQDIGPNGEVLPESKVFIEPPSGDQGRSASLQPGDLMLVITGATVGRCSLFREELEPGFVSQHVGICRLPKDSIDPDFALWGLRGPHGQEQLLGQRYGQGKPGLNLSNIRAITLPIPLLPEQHRIVAYLDGLQSKVDALKKLQSETAAELTALLPSILDKAFKGEF